LNKNILNSLLLVLVVLVSFAPACSYVEEETDYWISAFDFIEKVETSQPDAAWMLLSAEAQDKLSASQLTAPNRDLLHVVTAFDMARLSVQPDRTFNMVVENLGGEKGTIQISFVEEDGEMKIANISISMTATDTPIKGENR
jgi:hypothetical protein